MNPSPEEIAAVITDKGYALFTNDAGYDLNLFGIRSDDKNANSFNDVVGVMYRRDGRWCSFIFPATTDPGLYWRRHPMNVDGTAIMKPGQYRGAYKVGTHKGYSALQQVKPVTVYRDSDGDGVLDMKAGSEQTGMFGINIHRANHARASDEVNKWSAGCQVIQDPTHHGFLMDLAAVSAAFYGPGISYTLLTEEDF